MASYCSATGFRQQLASCSGRGPWPVTRRLALPVLPPPAGRRAEAAVRASSLADEAAEQEQQLMEATEQQRLYGNREPVKRMEFVYMSAEEAAAEEAAAAEAYAEGMQEYAELQEWLLYRTWRFGLLFSGYLLIAASGEAAFCELVGAATGYGYFKWLIADVERLQPGDRIPLKDAEKEPQLLRWVAKLFAAYRQALKPRLLVLPGLLALVAAYNSTVGPEGQLGMVEQGCLLGGFLSWKVALVLKIYKDLRPQPLTADDVLRASRPVLVQVDDVKLDIREVSKKVEQQRQEAEQQEQAQQQQQQPAQAAAPEGQQEQQQRQ